MKTAKKKKKRHAANQTYGQSDKLEQPSSRIDETHTGLSFHSRHAPRFVKHKWIYFCKRGSTFAVTQFTLRLKFSRFSSFLPAPKPTSHWNIMKESEPSPGPIQLRSFSVSAIARTTRVNNWSTSIGTSCGEVIYESHSNQSFSHLVNQRNRSLKSLALNGVGDLLYSCQHNFRARKWKKWLMFVLY